MLFSRAAVVAAVGQMAMVAAQKTHEFDWTLTWKTVNPDGMADRQVVSINDQWPLPVLRISKGDRIVATVHNNLTEPHTNSSIHWHGLFQNGTSDMDGPSWVTQCPHAPNTDFVYNFTIEQNGTYWYHAHVDNLYPDGYRQILLVDDDEPWFEDEYEEELSFTLSDWYHELTEIIAAEDFMSLYNPTGAEPVPQCLLFNDTLNPKFKVEPNTTYRLRIANTGAFSAYVFYIPGYNFTIVEADGVYTEAAEASSIYISAAQRYSILFTTGPDTNTSYQMVQVADSSLYDVIPPDLTLNRTGFLVTSDDAECVEVDNHQIFESGPVVQDEDEPVAEADLTSDNLDYFDDFTLVPSDGMELLPDPDQEFTLKVTLTNLLDGINYAFFNDISWTHAKVPSLYTVLSAPSDNVTLDASIYGSDTHPLVLEHNNVIQVVLNNFDAGSHPFHLHGHHFQILVRAASIGADDDSDYYPYDPETQNVTFPEVPMRRDVLVVKPYSHFVIRFVADNPGVWLFHCHIDWHLTQGLALEFVEAPIQIRERIKVPDSSFEACKLSSLPYEGNAAANTQDFTNLSGQNKQVDWLPNGFTARGIVALVFSCICAFVGMGFLVWYGISDTPETVAETAEHILDEPVDGEAIINHN